MKLGVSAELGCEEELVIFTEGELAQLEISRTNDKPKIVSFICERCASSVSVDLALLVHVISISNNSLWLKLDLITCVR